MSTALRDRVGSWARDTALNLAVFRITVAAVIVAVHDVHRLALAAARLPPAVRTAPVGWALASRAVPVTPAVADVLHLVLLGAAITGGLGLFSRASFAVVALVGLFFWGPAQTIGSAVHFHHLLWFAALLAVSPCGDALSVDRILARRRGRPLAATEASLAHGVPIRAAWLLLGAVFFFPGLWKLLTGGLAWITSDNLRNQMFAKWTEMADFTPLARVDRVPHLLQLGALATVALELSFPLLVLFRRTRPVAAVGAFLFHQATAAFMGLRFPSLWWCYPVLFDWSALAVRFGAEPPSPGVARSPVAPLVMSAALLLGAVSFGAAGESDGWPFACYPKFDRLAGETLPALEVTLVRADGEAPVPTRAMFPYGRTQRYWALTWSLLGAHRSERATAARFAAFWRDVANRPAVRPLLPGARAVRFYRATISTIPERRDAPPIARRLLVELPLRAAASGGTTPVPRRSRGS